MIRVGYIILGHDKPKQLLRLMSRLESDSTYIYLHLDKRVSLRPFMGCTGFDKVKNLHFLKRFKSYWGGFGIVSATLVGMERALKDKCDYIILLSGSDYPIKSNEAINEFLSQQNGKSFLTYYKMPASHWIEDQEINRIRKYYFRLNGKLFEYPIHPLSKSTRRKILNIILSWFLPKSRKFPVRLIPYGGDQWFCITNGVCKEILHFYQKHPTLVKFLKHSFAPDEIFLQTAIFNTDSVSLTGCVVNESITLINWENKNNPSPAYFKDSDFDELLNSKKLFARKFDAAQTPDLLDKVDGQLLHQSSSQAK